MTVTIDSLVQESGFTHRVTWESSLGPNTEVNLYQNGELIATTTSDEWLFTVPPLENLYFEIIDADEEREGGISSRRIGLGWYNSEDENPDEVDYYRIDEFEDAAWTEVNRVPNNAITFFFWESPFLPNLVEKTYRVVAVGINGNDGAAREFVTTPVGFDDVPIATYDHASGTGKVTVTIT